MAGFEASCHEAYQKVFNDADPSDWCTLGYTGRKLAAISCSTGGLKAAVQNFDDAQVMYTLVRIAKTDDGGDSKRVKFVFITWVGEDAPAMKKGAVGSTKSQVGEMFKGYHVEKQIFERSDLDTLEADLDAMLKTAGGANYDMGNINAGVKAGDSAAIKNASKSFFMQKDKETTITGVTFEKNISSSKTISACDLGGRTMTAGAADSKANTVGYTAPPPSEERIKEDKPADASTPTPAEPTKIAAPAFTAFTATAPVKEPTPKPAAEPTLEPAVDPTTEPAEEPSPAAPEEPSPAAPEEPTPEPFKEPKSEAAEEPTSEPAEELTPVALEDKEDEPTSPAPSTATDA